MWSRVVEVMLGCWLLMSPFVFRYPAEPWHLWANDFSCGVLVATFALLSYWRPTRHAHLLSLVLVVWLIGFAYWNAGEGYWQAQESAIPAAQNYIVVALVLVLFAVIPNDASLPPESRRAARIAAATEMALERCGAPQD